LRLPTDDRAGLETLSRSFSNDQYCALRLELLPDPGTATEVRPSTDLTRACGGERPSAARRRRLAGFREELVSHPLADKQHEGPLVATSAGVEYPGGTARPWPGCPGISDPAEQSLEPASLSGT